MKSENIQESWHDKLDALRKELDQKIEKKLSNEWALGAIVIIAAAIGGTYIWLMGMNEKITRAETKIEMMQALSIQQSSLLQNSPQNAVKK